MAEIVLDDFFFFFLPLLYTYNIEEMNCFVFSGNNIFDWFPLCVEISFSLGEKGKRQDRISSSVGYLENASNFNIKT